MPAEGLAGLPAATRRSSTVSLRLVPFDDDAEADTGYRPPPHPDDRLWRHPSEMSDHPIVPIGGPRPAPPTVTHSEVPRSRRWGALVTAGGVGALLAGTGFVVLGGGERVVERSVTERVALGPTSAPVAPGGDTVDTVRQQVAPAVVAVDAGAAGGGGPSGSGVVVRDDGIVVTSAALVVGAATPRVRLADGTSPGAVLVGADPSTGLAVLDLDGDGYTSSVLADGEPLARGATSYAISTRSSGGTATGAGVVGPAQRYIGPAGTAIDGIEIAGDADDRAIGGPVVDARGAVVGITTAVDDGGAWYVAPVSVARRVTEDLLTLGVARNSWLGIEGTDVAGGNTAGPGDAGILADGGTGSGSTAGGTDPASPGSTGEAPAADGTLVASVVPGSPAALGGLLPGDVVVALDGREITHMADLIVSLRAHVPGDRVDITVVRADGGRVTLVLTLGEAPAPAR